MQTGEMTVAAFLDALAAKESTPGGGGAAAVCAAQAAALLSMVVQFTLGNQKFAAVESEMLDYLAQTEALRKDCLALADADVVAFNAVAACYSMPRKTDEEKAARTQAMQSALKGATETPFTIAERCLDILILAEPIGQRGNPNVVSDAATALYLTHAALRSALVNVDINLKFIRDDEYVQTWSSKRTALMTQASTRFAAAKQACEQTLELEL